MNAVLFTMLPPAAAHDRMRLPARPTRASSIPPRASGRRQQITRDRLLRRRRHLEQQIDVSVLAELANEARGSFEEREVQVSRTCARRDWTCALARL
jgi:hypothetical protein